MNHTNKIIPLFYVILFSQKSKREILWRPPPPPSCSLPLTSFPFGVIDRCCSLFIWLGFNNMKPIARSGSCCCLCGPLPVSCPLIEKWERGRRRMNQRCVIYYEKRLNGNRAASEINTEHGAVSLQDGSEYQTRTSSCSFFFSLFLTTVFTFARFLKSFRLVLVLGSSKNKHQIWKWHYWLWLTCLAISRQAHKSSRGIQLNFSAWADNVEMLTTANLRRVSDLRTTAGDREHESNGFQLFPAPMWQQKWAHLPWKILSDLVRACGQFGIFLSSVEFK